MESMMTNSAKKTNGLLIQTHMMRLYSGALPLLHGFGSGFSCVQNRLSEKPLKLSMENVGIKFMQEKTQRKKISCTRFAAF